MARLHIPLLMLLLAAPFTTAIPASSHLFARQSDSGSGSVCPSAQSACPSSLPVGFCCSTNDDCIPLAGNTTVLCCPKSNESGCNLINPITCNVDQQDPKKNPLAPIKTSVFDVELAKCGANTCCPFGYSCEDGRFCRINDNQDEKPGRGEQDGGSLTTVPIVTEPTSSPPSSQTSTGSSRESATSIPSDQQDDDTKDSSSSSSSSSGPDTTTIIGGVVGGIAALLALAIILFICARRRAKQKNPSPSSSSSSFSSGSPPPPSSGQTSHSRNFSSSSGPRGNTISEPIMQQNSYRTDFILKNPGNAAASVESTPAHLRNSVHPHISTIRDYDDHDHHQNPFRSPAPSQRGSACSVDDDGYDDDGVVGGASRHKSRASASTSTRRSSGKLAPIRGMRAPRTPKQQASYESINVFADPGTVDNRQNRYSRGTTVSGLMIGLRGDLEPETSRVTAASRGNSSNRLNVPGTTPRI